MFFSLIIRRWILCEVTFPVYVSSARDEQCVYTPFSQKTFPCTFCIRRILTSPVRINSLENRVSVTAESHHDRYLSILSSLYMYMYVCSLFLSSRVSRLHQRASRALVTFGNKFHTSLFTRELRRLSISGSVRECCGASARGAFSQRILPHRAAYAYAHLARRARSPH